MEPTLGSIVQPGQRLDPMYTSRTVVNALFVAFNNSHSVRRASTSPVRYYHRLQLNAASVLPSSAIDRLGLVPPPPFPAPVMREGAPLGFSGPAYLTVHGFTFAHSLPLNRGVGTGLVTIPSLHRGKGSQYTESHAAARDTYSQIERNHRQRLLLRL